MKATAWKLEAQKGDAPPKIPSTPNTALARRENRCPKDGDASDPSDHTLGVEARLASIGIATVPAGA
jgi:hypothetical protein